MSLSDTLGTVRVQGSSTEFRRFLRVFLKRPVVLIGVILVLGFLLTTIFANVLAPYDPYKIDLAHALAQPSSTHLLGTDAVGRDTFSRIIFGSRIALLVGVVALSIAAFLGSTIGLLAGYFGGWVNLVLMRLIDALMSFPMIIFALVLAALMGPGIANVMIAIGIAMTAPYARLVCGQVLSVKQNDYVLAARAGGASHMRIMLRHVFLNSLQPLIVLMTMQIGMTILVEASLSFLGVGIQSPTAAWGSMVNDGYLYLFKNPILSFAPGLCIMLTVFGFNMVGDGLRDALDPRLRGIL